MSSIKSWLAEKSKQLNLSHKPLPNSDLRQLVVFILKKDLAWLISHSEFILSDGQLSQLNQWHKKLLQGYPLAYITGQQVFWDLELAVNEHTLIPRPDTETLIEVCIESFNDHPKKILDLGTGSGAIALTLAKIYKNAKVIGVDNSAAAIEIATKNAQTNKIYNVEFIESDWFKSLNETHFDLIVSNPPYIAADDAHLPALKHEPRCALVAAEQGLAHYKRITSQAADFLRPCGLLLFEHGWNQQDEVQKIMAKAGFIEVTTKQDLAGHDRVTYGKRS